MSSFDQGLAAAQAWAEQAVAGAWLNPGDIRALAELKPDTPASLFEADSHRPLVAAFFGGTGVGKSTLLNRLAGQAIARTGVERPTSREVSIYLHDSIQLRHLPNHFPLDRVRIAQHHDAERRQVLWIDMPDIDSVEQHNRELVLDWLPHIDVLIYVVSPERYRDDKGWRMLQAHGGEHAWLFVINQWDRGHPLQYEDFAKLLVKGGFQDPIILRTDSRDPGPARKPDDFGQLQDVLREMADRHVMRQLERHAEALRLQGLRTALAGCLDRLGTAGGYAELAPEWGRIWDQTQGELLRGLEWPIQSVARAFVGHEANPLRRSIDLTRPGGHEAKPEPRAAAPLLWDDWAASRLRDTLDQLLLEAGQRGLPAAPLKVELDRVFESGGGRVLDEGQRCLRHALARPGNAFRRFLLKLSGGLAALLPILSISLVSYEVVKGYYESVARHLDFLGVDFAIHSVLLIGLSWLLPFFVYRQLKPSAEDTAIRGLRSGIGRALAGLGEDVAERLARTEERRARLVAEGRRIAGAADAAAPVEPLPGPGLLGRVLPTRPGPPRKDSGGIQSMFNTSK